MSSNYFIGEVYGGRTDINAFVTNALTNGGVDVTSDGGYTITINNWNGLTGAISISYNATPPSNVMVFINFEEGHEMVMLALRDSITNIPVYFNFSDEIISGKNLVNITTRSSFVTKETLNIVRLINAGNDEIVDLNLYIADSPVSQNVVYVDGSGNTFIGINTRLLVPYTP